jgi:hypothetical protein
VALPAAPGRRDRAEGGEGDHQVQHRGDEQGAGKTGESHQIEARDQHADRGAKAVGEIEQRERLAGVSPPEPEHAGAHEREGGAQQHRLWQDERAGDGPLDRRQERRARQRGIDGAVREAGGPAVDLVEHQSDHADRQLDQGVAAQRLPESLGEPAHQHRTRRHPAEEDHQHDDLGVRVVADEQAQVPGPDGLVDEPGRAGQDEQQVQYPSHARPPAYCPDLERGMARRKTLFRAGGKKRAPHCIDAARKRTRSAGKGASPRGARLSIERAVGGLAKSARGAFDSACRGELKQGLNGASSEH